MSNTTKSDAERFRAEAAQHRADERESFERCDTDGFVSQWASGLNARVADRNAEIAEHGGVAVFERTVLVHAESGELVEDARAVSTRYGRKWRIDATDEWLAYEPARPSTLAKHGYAERTESVVAPARAQTWAPGNARGLSGATSVQVVVFRTDDLAGGGRERNEWHFAGFPGEGAE